MRTLDRNQLVALIKEDETIREILPWSETLVKYHDNVNSGCACNKGKRGKATDNLYLDIIANFVNKNADVKDFIKSQLKEDQIDFLLDDKVILSI